MGRRQLIVLAGHMLSPLCTATTSWRVSAEAQTVQGKLLAHLMSVVRKAKTRWGYEIANEKSAFSSAVREPKKDMTVTPAKLATYACEGTRHQRTRTGHAPRK